MHFDMVLKLYFDTYILNITYVNFTPYRDSSRTLYYFLQAFKADMKDPLYVEDFTGANKFDYYIVIQRDTSKQNPYECKKAAEYEKLTMKITYLEEIYHSVYMRFLSDIDHLDYYSSMSNTKCLSHRICLIQIKQKYYTRNVIPTVNHTNLRDNIVK